MSMTIQSSVKDKILATSSESPGKRMRQLKCCVTRQLWKREQMDGYTLWIKLYSKYENEIRYHPGKANVVIEALSRKEQN
ncbi:hypothetical protein Tco_0576445 [Tanacetum coccineum]